MMAGLPVELPDRPGSRSQIIEAFFKFSNLRTFGRGLDGYFAYYDEELKQLREGISKESWQMKDLAAKTYEDVFYVVELLRNTADSRRPTLRQRLLSRFPMSNDQGLNRSLDLAIRLWLMVNTQDPEFGGLRHEATAVQWDDESTLRSFLASLFPISRWPITAQSSRLGPHFTVAFMTNVCGLKVDWATSLHDHLQLDRNRNALKVFPYKCHLQALISGCQTSDDKRQYVQ